MPHCFQWLCDNPTLSQWIINILYNFLGNVDLAGQGIVKNIESILLNLAAGDTLEWYVTTYGYTAKIGGGSSNGGTTMFNAVRIVPDYTAA